MSKLHYLSLVTPGMIMVDVQSPTMFAEGKYGPFFVAALLGLVSGEAMIGGTQRDSPHTIMLNHQICGFSLFYLVARLAKMDVYKSAAFGVIGAFVGDRTGRPIKDSAEHLMKARHDGNERVGAFASISRIH